MWIDIILFAALAIYIFAKLLRELGKVEEEEKRNAIKHFVKEQTNLRPLNPDDNPLVKEQEGLIILDSDQEDKYDIDPISKQILDQLDHRLKLELIAVLRTVDTSAAAFTEGANQAFRMTIESFAAGDLTTLQTLLSKEAFDQFAKIVNDRQKNGQILHSKIVSLDETKVLDAKVQDDYAAITVKFVSHQANYLTNQAGTLVEGDQNEISQIIDIWTFKKDYRLKEDPNWFISSTNSMNYQS